MESQIKGHTVSPQMTLLVKNPFANAGDIEAQVPPTGQVDPLKEGMVTHSSILAWRILWTEEHAGHQKLDMTERLRTRGLTPRSPFQGFYCQ